MSSLVINGTSGDDTIVITATGTDSGLYSINGGAAIAFSGLTSLTVTGGAGNDTLTIVNPDGGLLAPAGGIAYDGGGDPDDALEVLGGTAIAATYTAGATPDAGTLSYVGAAGTQTIQFAGIAPIVDTVAAGTLTINGTAGADTISVSDGGLANGFQSTLVSSAGTFESVQFANKVAVTINGQGGGDSVNFNNPTAAADLVTVIVQNVGTVTQTGAINYVQFSVSATGPVTLPGSNNVFELAAAVSGAGSAFTFNNNTSLVVATVGGIPGVSTNNGPISLTTTNGNILVNNTAALFDVFAGESNVVINGGSTGATDYGVVVNPNAGVVGAGGVQFAGDNIVFGAGAGVIAGSGTVTLRPYNPGTLINLGGADGVNTLGLTDAELDAISAGVLRIGDASAGDISFTAALTPVGTGQVELVTGGAIQDNFAGTDITVARLGMTAQTGIGVSGLFTLIEAAVSNLEAQTTTGGISVMSPTGDLTIGGVNPTLTGLRVLSSGNIFVQAIAGSIILADTDGAATVLGGNSGGDVILDAVGLTSDLTSTVDSPAVAAPHGNITLTAGRDILLGAIGADFDSDVLAYGSIELNASHDLVIDGDADIVSDVFGGNTGGTVSAFAGRDLRVTYLHGNDASIVAAGSAGGDVLLHSGPNGFVVLADGTVVSLSGEVIVRADRLSIDAASSITTGGTNSSVTLEPRSTNIGINLGSGTDAAISMLELSDAELDRITTPMLRIGKTTSTNITISSQITADGHYGTLALRTSTGILDGTPGEQTDISVNKLELQAASGIGSANDLDIDTLTLAFRNTTTGGVLLANASALTIGAVDALTSSSNSGGGLQMVVNGPLTIATDVSAAGSVSLQAVETASPGDNLSVLSGVTVQSTGSSVELLAGDNLTLPAGSTVQGTTVQTYVDFGSDAGVGGTGIHNGTLSGSTIRLFGFGDNDTLIGSASAEELYAQDGNDVLNGMGGADTMYGDLGNDSYFVDVGSDVAIEGPGQGIDAVYAGVSYALSDNVENLYLQGTSDLGGFGNGGANFIQGNTGNNVLDGQGGADAMQGGTGNDTYFVNSSFDTIVENAGEGADLVLASASYALSSNVENLTMLGTGDVAAYGNALVNALTGNPGNNVLDGMGGVDAMAGGTGNDSYVVDSSFETVTENTAEGADIVYASASYGLPTNVETLVLTGTGNLNGTGNALVNTIVGNSGDNSLDGMGGADTMMGGGGNDTYFVDSSLETIGENPGEGTDIVFASASYGLAANVENLVLLGLGNLNGSGNGLVNNITGNSGNNSLDGMGGADSMAGGGGNDSYFVDNNFETVNESLGEGTDIVFASVSYGLAANVENLVLTGAGNLNGSGNGLVNNITGNSGNNSLDGMGGVDTMVGAAGNDTYFVDSSFETVSENAAEGTDIVFAAASYGLSLNVENLVLTGVGNFNGSGNALVNNIIGNSGNNSLDGGAGADTMVGGAGNDSYFVDSSFETIGENLGEGTDIAFASASYGLAANVENLVLTGVGNINGSGNTLVNTLTGNSGNNSLDGGAGADTMAGGAGTDIYYVDNNFEVINESPGEGTDTVYSTVSFQLGGNVEFLYLQGVGNINGFGDAVTNFIQGNSGDNGINGGGGTDALYGMGGNDLFIFNVGEANGDILYDFDGGGASTIDSIQFVGFGTAGGGATFTQIGASNQWQIHSGIDGHNEIITFNNGATVNANDFFFT